MPPKRVNTKVEAANAKKALSQSAKDAASAAAAERETAADWAQGSNARGASRAGAAAGKADEAARKKREKEALLAEEEAGLGAGGRAKAGGIGKKNVKGKKDDLSFLEDGLVSAADKKARKKKEDATKKAAAQLRKEGEAQAAKAAKAGSLTGNGIVDASEITGDGLGGIAGNQNAPLDDGGVSGIDGGLSVFSFGDRPEISDKNRRALHLQFEEKTLPRMREEQPGLRLQQYKERIFELWRKSPENPANKEGGGKAP
ncbi:hypothetical protein TeGR_g12749 [Tetraparma gracilis]|uniref:DUF1014-domain-containing protein n=1 Tax=Tetraparma gracilis TaxID=2962635 RepID=A0ABQ6MWD7_9STRA|nr:hypothetical protein TeGR_g12749 [Tetraparma gracilis]